MSRLQANFSLVSTILIALIGLWIGAHSGSWLLESMGVVQSPSLPHARGLMRKADNPSDPTKDRARLTAISYLLVGVDNLDQDIPTLEAVWVATYYEGHTLVELTGITPTRKLQAAFRKEDLYLESILAPQPQSPFVSRIVLDHDDLAQITDMLGGLRLGGKARNGLSVLNYVQEPTSQSERLLRQAAAVQAMVAAVAVNGERLNIGGLLRHVSKGEFSIDNLIALADSRSPLRTEHVRVRIIPASNFFSDERT